MTEPLINTISVPGAAELTAQATPPVAVSPAPARPASTQPGAPKSFGDTMQTVGAEGVDEVSTTLVPPDTAVAAVKISQPTTILDLALPTQPALPVTPIAGEAMTGLPVEAVNPELSSGMPLPDTGKTLPPINQLPELQTMAVRDTVVRQMAPGTSTPQGVLYDPVQAAVVSVMPKPLPTGAQLAPENGTHTPVPTIINTDEPALRAARPGVAPEPFIEIETVSPQLAQRVIEPASLPNELLVVSRGVVMADFAAMSADLVQTGFAQPAGQTPLQFDQLMELPQFQNLRPLQPLADPKTFMEGLGQRLMVMSEGGVQSARMKLYPENLGSLDIRIHVEDDTARVWFNTSNGQAREALEAALPKLKELFAQQGMELVQADVGASHDQGSGGDAFDSSDDSYSDQIDGGPEHMPESVGLLSTLAVSKHSLDIYV